MFTISPTDNSLNYWPQFCPMNLYLAACSLLTSDPAYGLVSLWSAVSRLGLLTPPLTELGTSTGHRQLCPCSPDNSTLKSYSDGTLWLVPLLHPFRTCLNFQGCSKGRIGQTVRTKQTFGPDTTCSPIWWTPKFGGCLAGCSSTERPTRHYAHHSAF